jgi:AcrR family transcriptional regulator
MNVEARRRRATSEATQTRLTSAARELFLGSGYEATPVRKIADEAGVTIGAFYGHFGSKRTALFKVVRDMNEPSRGRRSPFPTLAHRALVLTVASFAHEDHEAARVLAEVLQVIAPGAGEALDAAKAGGLLVDLARRT